HAEIKEIDQRLDVTLRLVVRPHYPKSEVWLAFLEYHAWDQRVEGALPRSNDVRMPGIQLKQRATIVQNDSSIGGDNSRTKSLEQAVDERDCIAFLIDNGQIHGVRILAKTRLWIRHGPIAGNQFPSFSGVLLRYET